MATLFFAVAAPLCIPTNGARGGTLFTSGFRDCRNWAAHGPRFELKGCTKTRALMPLLKTVPSSTVPGLPLQVAVTVSGVLQPVANVLETALSSGSGCIWESHV